VDWLEEQGATTTATASDAAGVYDKTTQMSRYREFNPATGTDYRRKTTSTKKTSTEETFHDK
jgi:putative ATP-grasp target RiPP